MKYTLHHVESAKSYYSHAYFMLFNFIGVLGTGTQAQAPKQRQIACSCSDGGEVSVWTLGGASPTQLNLHDGDKSWSHQADGDPRLLDPGFERCQNPTMSWISQTISENIRNRSGQTCSNNVRAFSDNVRLVSDSFIQKSNNVRIRPEMSRHLVTFSDRA